MGVLSVHNECPPVEMGPDVKAICYGLVLGEEGTAGLLRSLADCLQAMAAMDDTVASLVSGWSAALDNGGERPYVDPRQEVLRNFDRSLDNLSGTVERIDTTVQKLFELKAYARSAKDAGRGRGFLAALNDAGGADFDSLIDRRIEGLRRLKVRVKVLQHLRGVGEEALESGDSAEFFLVFMQPIRDMAIDLNNLFSEVLHGALASHQALFRNCRLQGEGESAPAVERVRAPELVTV